jgi:membrane protein DedA with SNARE-associated domain
MSLIAETYALWFLAGLIAIECIGIPVPGETTLIASAIYAGTRGHLSIWVIITAAIIGAIVGNIVGFWIGRALGYGLLIHYGPYIGLTEPRIKIGEYLFRRYGVIIVVLARFVPLLRSMAALLAGANLMPTGRFLLATVVGAVAWVTLIGLAAYHFGEQLKHLSMSARVIAIAVAALLLAAVAMLIARNEKYLQAQAEKEIPGPLPPD